MARRKTKDNRVVMYVRVKPEEHAKVIKIVELRGYPHTIASVAAEMFSRGLAADAGKPSARR